MSKPKLPTTDRNAQRDAPSEDGQGKVLADLPLVSVVMPCFNEEETIGSCIERIQQTFAAANINGEIVVCDNGSTDRSAAVAERMGARVVHEPVRGYGNAYLKGFAGARGTYLIMGDADDTYDFALIPKFLDLLQNKGCDFVTGSRYLDGGEEHITPLHRFLGNPVLTALLNTLFGTSYTDVYCGFRGLSRKAYDRIRPVSQGMEFNLELAINARRAGLRTAEVPIKLRPRKGRSKLRTFRDGWRSLRMMLLYSPNKIFLWPGTVFFVAGMLIHTALLLRLVTWDGRPAAGVTGIFATIFAVAGFQILSLGLHAKTYSWSRRFDKDNPALEWFYGHFKLEVGLTLGAGLFAFGGVIMALLVVQWMKAGMQPLPYPEWASFAATLIIIGCSTVFSSLFISAMSMNKGEERR